MKLFHTVIQQIHCDLSDGKDCNQCRLNVVIGLVLLTTFAIICSDVATCKRLDKS